MSDTAEIGSGAEKPLDIEGAAKFLGYSVGYTYRLFSGGTIPGNKLPNGGIRFFASDLRAFVSKNRKATTREMIDIADEQLSHTDIGRPS